MSAAEQLQLTATFVAQTYGASLICCQLTVFLSGISSLQTYMYFLNYGHDNVALKTLVTVIWSLGTVHAAFICHTVYHYLVGGYTRPGLLIEGEWSVYAATSIGVIVCFLIQIFFARMLFALLVTKKKWQIAVTAAMTTLISGQVAFGIFLSVRLFQIWELTKLKAAVYPAMVPLFSIRVISDTMTAASLCIVLYDSRPRAGFGRSIQTIKTLIIYSMNRFVLTTIIVIIQTIILITNPDSIWAMVIEFISVQLYVNSFLATLNSRNRVRNMGKGDMVFDTTSWFGPSAARFNPNESADNSVMMNGSTLDAGPRGTTRKAVHLDLGAAGGIGVTSETYVMSDFEAKQGGSTGANKC